MNSVPTIQDAEKFVLDTFGSSLSVMQDHFLTGSVAFEEATDESDIDIAFSVMSRGSVEGLLIAKGIAVRSSDYTSGTKAEVLAEGKPMKINFIFLHPLEYVVWYRAGGIYKSLPRQDSRAARHALFESIRAAVKTAFALAGVEVHKRNYLDFCSRSSAVDTKDCPF